MTQDRRNSFGRLIRDQRMALKKTLRDVAAAIGKSPVYVSDVERGRRGAFNRNLIDYEALAGVLELEIADLLVAAANSRGVVEIDVNSGDPETKALAVQLMRMVNQGSITNRELRQIIDGGADLPPAGRD